MTTMRDQNLKPNKFLNQTTSNAPEDLYAIIPPHPQKKRLGKGKGKKIDQPFWGVRERGVNTLGGKYRSKHG